MSSSLTCAHCGSSEIDTDQSRGDTFCTRCGTVIDENCIVSEVQFEEGSHGAAHIIGQRHDAEGPFKLFGGISGVLGSGRESRQVTLINAKRRIKTVCDQLRLNDHFIDMSFNFYKMALNRRLTHGRKHIHVIAACIYITCRTEGTSHLLLDLSDVAQVNVYELGRTYLKLTAALCITIPAIDPSLYIIRFAQHIDLGEKGDAEAEKIRNNVISTANRLVQRMKRDWMHYGRRPSGLCGAALLVAARLNEVHCSIKDIIKIVKVCETTIRKRLFEFSETPTSNLTLDEFMTIDLEGEEDPPCYKAAKRKQKSQLESEQNDEDLHNKVTQLQKLIDKNLEKSRKVQRNPFIKYMQGDGKLAKNNEEEIVENLIVEETVNTIEAVLRNEEFEEYDNYVQMKTLRPTAASLGLSRTSIVFEDKASKQIEVQKEESEQESKPDVNQESDELDLSGIDDDELESYILRPDEVAAKTSIWTRVHAEYLNEQKEKEERRMREENERREKEASGELQPRKKRKTKKRVQIQANSAGEAIEKMLQEKKISNKINYDVLKNLAPVVTESVLQITTSEEMPLIDEPRRSEESLASKSNSPLKRLTTLKNSSNISLFNLKEPLFTKLKSRARDSIENENEPLKNDKTTTVIETGNKESIKECDADEREYEEEEEEEEEEGEFAGEKKGMSIQELLGSQREDEFEQYEDYDYDYD